MKKWLAGVGGVAIALFSVQAAEIDFTSAEGYSSGQLSASANWMSTAAAFAVDASAGTVTLGTAGFAKARCLSSVEATESTALVGVGFSFNRTAGVTLPANQNQNVLGIAFENIPTGNQVVMFFARMGFNVKKYAIYVYENMGGITSKQSLTIDEKDLGFGTGDDVSDRLWMSMQLNRGADASSWTANLVISNQATGVVLKTVDVGPFDTSAAFFGGSINGVINSCALESASFTSNRVIDTFRVQGAVVTE